MASTIETALTGLVGILTFATRPEPFAGSLGAYKPTIAGLSRDDGQIVMQRQGEGALDGGDSAHRTGVLAFCQSEVDSANLPRFIVQQQPTTMTRHPTQVPWNNPNNCTRDQLIGYIAGCWRTGRTDIVAALLHAHATRAVPFTCQDIERDAPGTLKDPPIGDPLGPHDIMYLRVCAGDMAAALDLAGQFSLYVAILLAPAAADQEPTQILLQSIVCGQLDIYLATHENYAAALDHYWGGVPWRGQQCIANSLKDVVNIESERYHAVSLLDYLLPKHLLEELRKLDWQSELNAFIHGNPLVFAQLSARFLVAVLRDVVDYVDRIVRTLGTLEDMAKEVAIGVVTALRSYGAKAFGDLSKLVSDANVDPTGFTSAMLQVAASVLGFSVSNDDKAEAEFRARVTQSLDTIVKNTEATLKAIGDLQSEMKQGFESLAAEIKGDFYTLALGQLKAMVANANILICTVNAGHLSDDLGIRIQLAADELRKHIIFMCNEYHAGALPYCMHAYGVLMALLSVSGADLAELSVTRRAFGQAYFKEMLEAAQGPIAQLVALKDEERKAIDLCNSLLGKTVLCGVISEQQGTTVVVEIPIPGASPLSAPMALPQWINTGLRCKVNGSMDQPALITNVTEWVSLSTTKDAVDSVAAAQAHIAADMTVFPSAQFMVDSYLTDPVGSKEAIVALASSIGDRARKAAQDAIKSRKMQGQLEALVTSVRATFSI